MPCREQYSCALTPRKHLKHHHCYAEHNRHGTPLERNRTYVWTSEHLEVTWRADYRSQRLEEHRNTSKRKSVKESHQERCAKFGEKSRSKMFSFARFMKTPVVHTDTPIITAHIDHGMPRNCFRHVVPCSATVCLLIRIHVRIQYPDDEDDTKRSPSNSR